MVELEGPNPEILKMLANAPDQIEPQSMPLGEVVYNAWRSIVMVGQKHRNISQLLLLKNS